MLDTSLKSGMKCWYPSYISWQYERCREWNTDMNIRHLERPWEKEKEQKDRGDNIIHRRPPFSLIYLPLRCWCEIQSIKRERGSCWLRFPLSLSLSITVTVWVNRQRVGALKRLWHTFVTGEVSDASLPGEAVISSNQPDSNLKRSLIASDILHLQPSPNHPKFCFQKVAKNSKFLHVALLFSDIPIHTVLLFLKLFDYLVLIRVFSFFICDPSISHVTYLWYLLWLILRKRTITK